MAALHLEGLTQNDSKLAATVTRYLDSALAKHRMAIPDTSGDSAEPLLIAGMIISTSTWLLSHRRTPGEKYKLPLLAYSMIDGVSALLLATLSRFKTVEYGWFGSELPPTVEEDVTGSPLILRVRQDLKQLAGRFEIHAKSAKEKMAYEQGMKYVYWLFRAYVSKAHSVHAHRFIKAMPARIGSGFIELLSIHDPLAMALLARGISLLKLVDYAWWIHGAGEYQVMTYDIYGISGLMPSRHSWTMEWPLKVLSGEIASDI